MESLVPYTNEQRRFTTLVNFENTSSKTKRVYPSPKFTKGFTLVEILVTLAILTTILAIGALANINLFRQEQVLKEEMILVSTLHKARNRAMNNVNQTKHGVHIENGLDYYLIFKGDTYNSNDSTNEIIPREEKIISSGLTDIVFEQLSGNANEGNITLTDTGGKQKTIIISENGLIDW
jgi:prepilin-type N-terminal cleavage/methylation domain-containing protein